MGRPKPLLRVGGKTLLGRALDSVLRSGVAETVVVLGHAAGQVRMSVPLHRTVVVENPEYERGISTSLQVGIRAAPPETVAFLIVLGDQPFVETETIDLLLSSWKPAGPKILIPTFRSHRGNPVLLDRSLRDAILSLRGDVGFRSLFDQHLADVREIPVDDPGILVDLDAPEQLETLSRGLRSRRPMRALLEELAETTHGDGGAG